mmetsp:Transcript_29107/g.81894  ORF Transcript_29107/g.81894 Transcript_29107/m.81894 type:complete len:138 (+) Transcript_29107:159-572(+)
MSSMNFSTSKQFVRPPQRGIFPLDHDAECQIKMKEYIQCMNESNDTHYKCRTLSKDYLQCRMDHQLMSKENLDHLGYSEEQKVRGAKEYDKAKEKAGFIAGKHIDRKMDDWWFMRPWKKGWSEEKAGDTDGGAAEKK